jgi:hypothetical protein
LENQNVQIYLYARKLSNVENLINQNTILDETLVLNIFDDLITGTGINMCLFANKFTEIWHYVLT